MQVDIPERRSRTNGEANGLGTPTWKKLSLQMTQKLSNEWGPPQGEGYPACKIRHISIERSGVFSQLIRRDSGPHRPTGNPDAGMGTASESDDTKRIATEKACEEPLLTAEK